MKLTVNGAPTEVDDSTTVAEVVCDLAGADRGRGRGVAVAINGAVVPRSAWSSTAVADGDAVEVLAAVQGG